MRYTALGQVDLNDFPLLKLLTFSWVIMILPTILLKVMEQTPISWTELSSSIVLKFPLKTEENKSNSYTSCVGFCSDVMAFPMGLVTSFMCRFRVEMSVLKYEIRKERSSLQSFFTKRSNALPVTPRISVVQAAAVGISDVTKWNKAFIV